MMISRRSLLRSLVVIGLAFGLTAAASAQESLGELARQARKNKPTESSPKVITNDDLNSAAAPVGKPETSTGENSSAQAGDNSSKTPADGQAASGASAPVAGDKAKAENSEEQQAKLEKDWQDKLSAQKSEISLLERELDVLQRENKLRVANYYADAGTRLRNQAQYAEEDRKYHDQTAAKQKALDDAKAKLDSMKEEARKAGVPAGMIE